MNAFQNLLDISNGDQHIKNFRPQFLVLCKDDDKEHELIAFSALFKKAKGVSIYAKVLDTDLHLHHAKGEDEGLSILRVLIVLFYVVISASIFDFTFVVCARRHLCC